MTPYSDIYERFDMLIEDYNLNNVFQRDIHEWESICLGYLKSARTKFKQYKSIDGKRLEFYVNDDMRQFDTYLSEDEKEILAISMVYAWINREVNNILVLRPSLSDSDFKETSKNQFLSLKMELKNQINCDIKSKIKEYTYYKCYIDKV